MDFPPLHTNLPWVTTIPGTISDLDGDCSNNEESIITPSPVNHERKIIVANFLPLHAQREIKTGVWCFSLDEDSLLSQMKDGISSETEVIYVGSLKVDIDASEQEKIAHILLEDFNCVPTFLDPELQRKFYDGFCKEQLWPFFHYMTPLSQCNGDLIDWSCWLAYVAANEIFAKKVIEVINPYKDYVWIHDYHLMVLPTLLRKKFNHVKVGFFLHSPFPSSDFYRTLRVREEILRGLLNSDLIGFHTYNYGRNFLSSCSRILGLSHQCKQGYITLDYHGRTIYIKILPVGVHMGRLKFLLNERSTISKAKDIQERFKDKILILGVDDVDVFKGTSLKLQAVEQLLKQNSEWRGKLVLVQILNPERTSGRDVLKAKRTTTRMAEWINRTYGSTDYEPVILIDRPIPLYEKIAYYAVAECCIVNALRDGMNLVPYEYVVCRQGTPYIVGSNRTSMLVVSEFMGCSPSLSGAIMVNPWDIDGVANALIEAIKLSVTEKQLRHDKHYRYVRSHDVVYWTRSFVWDLERACKDYDNKQCRGIGFGLNFRVVSLSPEFRMLSIDHIVPTYRKSNRRAIFLDYDGTIVSQTSIGKAPDPEVTSVLTNLCSDPKNTVFIVSGRSRSYLGDWLSPFEMLGIAAEHGYFTRWRKTSDWESCPLLTNFDWKRTAEPVMRLYTEATDGSYIETKETALVWHYQDADPGFRSCQAMELLGHLEKLLANEPVVVKRGEYIVEVKPQGISKGSVVEKVLSTMVANGKRPDFVMCIGDDRSDEDMFERISSLISNPTLFPITPEIFACTVGKKPSKAKYYLDETNNVVELLKALSAASISGARTWFPYSILL